MIKSRETERINKIKKEKQLKFELKLLGLKHINKIPKEVQLKLF